MTEHIIVTDDKAVRIIRMNRGDKKNALTQAMYRAIGEAMDSAQDNPDIRCLLISGGPSIFSAGNDLEDFLAASASAKDRPLAAFDFLGSLARNTKPLVAAVEGAAIGVGTTMLFHCDHVIASTTATFSTPFIQLGLVPEAGSSLLFPRLMGHHRAFEMLAMGRPMTADDGHKAGFVNAIVPPGSAEEAAFKAATAIAALPAQAMAMTRKLLRPDPADVLARIQEEGKLFSERMSSEEAISAFKAFFARKKA